MAERLNVNPTRMELLSLKERLDMATRGHKLLKDKRDELMREFLDLVKKNQKLREKVEERLSDAFSSFLMAKAVMSEEGLESAITFSKTDMAVDFNASTVMGVPVAEFKWESMVRVKTVRFTLTVLPRLQVTLIPSCIICLKLWRN